MICGSHANVHCLGDTMEVFKNIVRSTFWIMIKDIGWLWTLPLTLFNLIFHIAPGRLLGAYEFHDRVGYALVWKTTGKGPKWLKRLWSKWAGNTIGTVVVLNVDPDSDDGKAVLRHELVHVKQCMVLGVFMALLYGICYLVGMMLPKVDAYRDCPFEVSARRISGR